MDFKFGSKKKLNGFSDPRSTSDLFFKDSSAQGASDGNIGALKSRCRQLVRRDLKKQMREEYDLYDLAKEDRRAKAGPQTVSKRSYGSTGSTPKTARKFGALCPMPRRIWCASFPAAKQWCSSTPANASMFSRTGALNQEATDARLL